MAKKNKGSLASWSFLIGVVIALVLGFLGTMNSTWIWVLVIIGLVVGLLNISESETHSFLWSGVVMIIASAFGQGVLIAVPVLNNVLQSLLLIFVPATIIVAVKNAFSLAKH